ncbi:MAG: glycosyltransferase family 4 protein [Actinomycetota bacterium]
MAESMRIAMIGQKGVPATYGGIERHVEELGTRLAARGHHVTVFCRTGYSNHRGDHRGMHLRRLPTVRTKHLDAVVHSSLSTLVTMLDPPDIVHYHALGPGLLSPLPRYFSRAKVVLTVHGLDHLRVKWGRGARAVLQTAAWMGARVPDATIGVSHSLADHYRTSYGRRIEHIPNGVTIGRPRPAKEITRRFGLVRGSYLLFVGRLVPEKAPDLLIRAYRCVPGNVRLVIVGGSSFTDGYAASLRRLAAADPRVLFTGYAYGAVLEELYANAAAFVLPSYLEGLPLTLLEAVSYGTPVVVSDIPPHKEIVTGDAPGRRLFRSGDEGSLAEALASTIETAPTARGESATFSQRVAGAYRWDDVAEATEDLYRRLLNGRPLRPSSWATGAAASRTRAAPSANAMAASTGTTASGRSRR